MARKAPRAVMVDHGETIVPLLSLPAAKPMVVTASAGGSRPSKEAEAAAAAGPPFDGLPWGLWQARTTLLAGLCKVTTAWHMAMVLYAATPSPFGEFRCKHRVSVAAGDSGNSSSSVPASWPTPDSFWDWTWDPWVPLCANGSAIDFSTAAALPLPHKCVWWYGLPTVNQWSGACYRQFVSSSSQLCYLVGIAVGGAICLTLLRRHSPRRILLVALVCEAVLAFVLSIAQVFWAHVLVRFVLAISSVHVFTAAATLSTDVCSGLARTLTASLFEIWWSLGIISISGFGWFALNWTTLQAIVSMPSFALILPCALLLPESPRWLLSRGRLEEAVDVWERAAALNGRADLLPPRPALTHRLGQLATAARSQRRSERSVWAAGEKGASAGGRCRHAARLLAVHAAYGCITNTFFGSILNVRNWGTPGMLGLSIGEAAAGVSGIVGFCVGTALSLRCGRPLLWLGLGLLAAGGAGLCAHLVPRHPLPITLLALVERVAVAAAVPTLNNCSPQLVPPAQRASLTFSCLLFGRVCLLAAPFVGNLVVYGEAFPLTAFALQLILAGASSLILVLLAHHEETRQKDVSTMS